MEKNTKSLKKKWKTQQGQTSPQVSLLSKQGQTSSELNWAHTENVSEKNWDILYT